MSLHHAHQPLLLGCRMLLPGAGKILLNYNIIDTKLHSSVNLISSCLQPIQIPWIPVITIVANAMQQTGN